VQERGEIGIVGVQRGADEVVAATVSRSISPTSTPASITGEP